MSILLPVRNEGINLRIMLKILRAVVEVPHEVLVVYDSANDDSIAVVNEVHQIYPELRGIQNTLGHGVVNAIRAGVAASEGDKPLIAMPHINRTTSFGVRYCPSSFSSMKESAKNLPKTSFKMSKPRKLKDDVCR